jgi:CheY-like chemotaxis protein
LTILPPPCLRKKEQQENDAGRGQIPIIALTANAVTGMKEMFLEKGFNDFLAKPIDIGKLDETLDRWIPKEKCESGHPVIAHEPVKEDIKKFVIMVDDNPANLKIGKNILSEKYRVATSPSAKKLFGLLKNSSIMCWPCFPMTVLPSSTWIVAGNTGKKRRRMIGTGYST